MNSSASEDNTERVLITCLMPTYGRPDYVREAIWCFCQQDEPDSELIVLNDCPAQTFVGEMPRVRVINQLERFSTLGEKRNAGIELAEGDIIAVWDDDDLSLPWRLSLTRLELQRHNTPFYRPSEFYGYWGEGNLHDNQVTLGWASHGLTAFTKQLWADVGGYPAQDVGEDAEFFHAIHRHLGEADGSEKCYPIAKNDRFYILRGTSDYHHMSMAGGRNPLNTTPGEYPIDPRPIADPLLRAHYERLVEEHSAG